MQDQPLVTIAIPTFQSEKYVVEAINCALSQTYKNIEVIVSDNGSTDQTVNKIHEMVKTDPRIRFFPHDKNRGPTFNFTFVFEQAKGEFFFWLGDDDWLDQNYVETLVFRMIKNPGLAASVGLPNYYIGDEFFQNGVAIDVLHRSRLMRIASYLFQVADNGIFYGCIRRKWLAEVPFENVMGWDWLMFSALAYRGGLLTDKNVHLHRRLGRISSSYERIALAMELPEWNARFPYLAIIQSINRALWRNPKAFPGLCWWEKLAYSLVICATFLLKLIRVYYWRLRNYIRSWRSESDAPNSR